MSSDSEFFRYKTTYPDGQQYYSRSYRAKGPATAAMKGEMKWPRNKEKVYNIQQLAAVLRYEEHYSYEGGLIEKPVARLEWIDYEK